MLFCLALAPAMSQTLHPGRKIVVSGSVSNLGPGFDALSVAVSVFLTLEVLDVEPDRSGRVDFEFAGGPGPSGENRILTGFQRAAARFGDDTPGIRVRVTSDIPMKAGLGSSSAAAVAGIRLYEAATKPRDLQDLMQIATAIEGHPDNAAAALLGGLTLSCQASNERIETLSWKWPADLKFVVSTPAAELETAFARTVLPAQIPMRDAVYNLQRALLFVRALDLGRYELLREALADRWHQPARQRFVPGLAEALALDHPSVLGVCLSGAGPSVAVIARDGQTAEAEAALGAIYSKLGVPCTIRTLSAHQPER
jgi:homoserine kinase